MADLDLRSPIARGRPIRLTDYIAAFDFSESDNAAAIRSSPLNEVASLLGGVQGLQDEIDARVAGDQLQSVVIVSEAELTSTLNAQADSAMALELVFTQSFSSGSEMYEAGLVAYVAPMSRSIERRFVIVSAAALAVETQARTSGDRIQAREVDNQNTLTALAQGQALSSRPLIVVITAAFGSYPVGRVLYYPPRSSAVEELFTLGTGSGTLADGSVTTAKLANGAVTTRKLAANSVTQGILANSAIIDTTRIFNNAVTGAKIPANAITRGHMDDQAVGEPELTEAVRGKLLPTFPAEGSRDNKVPKFDGDTLGWEVDSGDAGGSTDQTARDAAAAAQRTANTNTAAIARKQDTLTHSQLLDLLQFDVVPGVVVGYALDDVTVDWRVLVTGAGGANVPDTWFSLELEGNVTLAAPPPSTPGADLHRHRLSATDSYQFTLSTAGRNNIVSGRTSVRQGRDIFAVIKFFDAITAGNQVDQRTIAVDWLAADVVDATARRSAAGAQAAANAANSAAGTAQATADAALPRSGGTMTGKIVLDGAPTAGGWYPTPRYRRVGWHVHHARRRERTPRRARPDRLGAAAPHLQHACAAVSVVVYGEDVPDRLAPARRCPCHGRCEPAGRV